MSEYVGRNSECKGPEAGESLADSRNSVGKASEHGKQELRSQRERQRRGRLGAWEATLRALALTLSHEKSLQVRSSSDISSTFQQSSLLSTLCHYINNSIEFLLGT